MSLVANRDSDGKQTLPAPLSKVLCGTPRPTYFHLLPIPLLPPLLLCPGPRLIPPCCSDTVPTRADVNPCPQSTPADSL